jgi:hypothetical protein
MLIFDHSSPAPTGLAGSSGRGGVLPRSKRALVRKLVL